MPLIATLPRSVGTAAIRRGGIVALILCLVAALSIGTFADPQVAQAVGKTVSAGIDKIRTVASMLAQRSPGHRPKGRLASLKHKRPVLHARALPKVRHLLPPIPALVAMPPVPPMAPPNIAPPLYAVVAGGPPELPPIVAPPSAGGPPIFSPIPLPGGGGGFFPPPIVTTSVPPPPPPTVAAVPEPATWAMMLIGFAMVGATLRLKRRQRPEHAAGSR